MATMSVHDIVKGQAIKFKTVLSHDNVVWSGTVSAVCDYYTAQHFEDLDVRHQEYCRENTTVLSKENLTYILLTVNENGTQSVIHAFALDWIDASTLEEINVATYTDFRVYNISVARANDLKTYIAGLGYVVETLE